MAIRIYNESRESVEEALMGAKDEGYFLTGLSNGQFEKLHGRSSVSPKEHFQFYIGGLVNMHTNSPGSRDRLYRIDSTK